MSARHTSPRAIRKALELLLELPPEALADLAERLVDRLDAVSGAGAEDEEDNEDGCFAEDVSLPGHLGIGDQDDAEPDDDREPDDDAEEETDQGPSEDEPAFWSRSYVSVTAWTHNGVKKHAWVVDYTDGGGTRRLKTFDLKRDADAYRLKAQTEIEAGVHTPDRESLRFHVLAEQYIVNMEARANEGRGLSHGYVTRLRASIRRHIVPGFKQRLI